MSIKISGMKERRFQRCCNGDIRYIPWNCIYPLVVVKYTQIYEKDNRQKNACWRKEKCRMIEKRKKIQPVVDLLEYMIRCGKISNEGGHKIFAVVLKDPDLTDRVMDILDLELSEQETIAKVERLL